MFRLHETPSVLLSVCMLAASAPIAGAEREDCGQRLLDLRSTLAATTTEVTAELVDAISAALDACPGPAVPQVSPPPGPPVGCRTPQHAEFPNVPVDFTITVLGETRLFRDVAERATLNAFSAGGHHTVDYYARGPTLGVYGDNSGTGAVFISFLIEDRGTGTATAACDADGNLCGGYGEADFLGLFQMKVHSTVSECA